MSQVKANSFTDASGGSNAVLYGVAAPANSMGFRNRIINGDMRIDQRNAGASVTATSTAAYIVDRFVAGMVGANGTMQRVSSGRTDFPFALRLTGTSSTTVCWVAQRVESVNCADLVGQSVTISFLAAASALTGVAVNLSYANSSDSFGSVTSISSQSKTITSTLTQYTVTVSSLPAGAANGLYLEFVPNGNLGTGTFTITGVQLEAGSVVSPFERRDYGRELMMCQRYYHRQGSGLQYLQIGAFLWDGTANCSFNYQLPVTMRAIPTFSRSGGYTSSLGSPNATMYVDSQASTTKAVNLITVGGSGGTSGMSTYIRANNDMAAFFDFSAEL